MILKIVKAVWFLSLLALFGSFLFIYAALPDQVIVHEGSVAVIISREVFFYSALIFMAIVNVMVFLVSRLYNPGAQDFQTWFYGLVITLNIFFIIAFNFVNLYNSSEKFDYNSIGYIIYGSVILVCGWAISWPFYALGRKFLNKQSV